MPFQFLTYIQPTHYFRLLKKDETSVFPVFESLPSAIKSQLCRDEAYQSNLAISYDLSWQAIQKGYIGESITYQSFDRLPIVDEYRFIRKNFHSAWVLYVLLIRALTLHNPILESSAFLKTRKVKRVNEHSTPISQPDYADFKSELIQNRPLVSVIIPTLNRYQYLKDVLQDLEKQDYSHFEVLVVDQSEPFQEDFYNDFKLNIHLIFQKERALWLARNTAIKKSKGEYILLFDDDSRVDTDWVSQHLKALDFFEADLSSGVSISQQGSKVPENYSHFGISSQLDTGNVSLKKSIFRSIGLFDRQFEKQRMGDGEFGLRAYLEGFKNISNPHAKRLHLKVGSGGLREMGSWDGFRPKKWLDPRPIPSVLYLFRKYFGNKSAKWALLKTVPSSIIPYKYKQNSYLMLLGIVLSFFLLPLVLWQVSKSWKLASVKLKEGAKIEELG